MSDFLELFEKDPDEVKEYGIDWSDELGSDSISTSTWETPTPSTSPALAYDSTSTDGQTAKAMIKGGVAGEEYICANQITTTDSGETLEESLKIVVKDK